MNTNLKIFLLSFILLLSTLLLLQSLVITYYIFTDDYFYKGNFNNEEFYNKYYNFTLIIKLIPQVLLICNIFIFRHYLKIKWKVFLLNLLIVALIFRFANKSFNSLFIITKSHIVNNIFSVIVLFTICSFSFLLLKKINKEYHSNIQ